MQLALVDAVKNGVRFPLAPAGRRSGKSERFKRFIAKQAMQNANELYFVAAPTYTQVKKIFWDDLKAFTLSSTHPKRPSESELKIYMPNGSEIHLVGLDKPERIEGINWTGGGIDEIADIKPDSWPLHIYPALNTVNPLRPDYRPWCWLLGVPDGLNHYYDMCKLAESGADKDYKVFHWKSSEILPKDVIEAAKRTLSEKDYKQEYEASFETATGAIYYAFDRDACDTFYEADGKEPLHIGMDFNVNNMAAIVHIVKPKKVYAVDEFIGYRDTPDLCLAIKERYPNNNIFVYPDASGQNTSSKSASESDLTILKEHGFTVRVKSTNPRVKDRISAMNTVLEKGVYFINQRICVQYIECLEKQSYKENGEPDKKSGHDHANDAGGYFIYNRFPVNRKLISSGKMTGL